MAVISDITVNVALSQPVSGLGFGVPLIFERLASTARLQSETASSLCRTANISTQ